jgi:hypothetical protein
MDDQAEVTEQGRRTRTKVEQLVAEFAGSGLNRTEFGGLVTIELAAAKAITGDHSGCRLVVVLPHGTKSRCKPTHMGSAQAGPKVAAILPVVEPCHRLKIPAREYLASPLPGFANLSIQHLPQLTPMARAVKQDQPPDSPTTLHIVKVH